MFNRINLGGNGDTKRQEIISSQQKGIHSEEQDPGFPPFSIEIGGCLIKSTNFDASGLFFLQLCVLWISPIPATAWNFRNFPNSPHVSGNPRLPQGVSPASRELWRRELRGFRAERGERICCSCHPHHGDRWAPG